MSKKRITILTVTILIIILISVALFIFLRSRNQNLIGNQSTPTSSPISSPISISKTQDTSEDLKYFFDPDDIQKTTLYSKNTVTNEIKQVLSLDSYSGKGILGTSPDRKYLIIMRGAQYVGGLRYNIYDLDSGTLVANLAPYQGKNVIWISNSEFIFDDTKPKCESIDVNGGQLNCESEDLYFTRYNLETKTSTNIYRYPKVNGYATNIEKLALSSDGNIIIVIKESTIVEGKDTLIGEKEFIYYILSNQFLEI